MVHFFPRGLELMELLSVVRDRCRRQIRTPTRGTLDAVDIGGRAWFFRCPPYPKIAGKVIERVSVEEVRSMDYYQKKECTEEFHIRRKDRTEMSQRRG